MNLSPKIQKPIAAYAVLVGFCMFGMWSMFLLTGQVPELQTSPWSIGMHLAAEFTTALLLIISGLALWQGSPWARAGMLFSLGMLVYTVIQSPGYYIQLGQPAFVGMFAILGILAVFCLFPLIRSLTSTAS